MLMNVAWTSLLHAIFYQRRIKPWYVSGGTGYGRRYERVDGEHKHWELAECMRQYWQGSNPAERRNLEFFLALRNKIEHRDFPELDPALYGECQAMLMNFEDVLVKEFGTDYALADDLGIALQFSVFRPAEQEKALRRLEGSAVSDVREFIRKFRADLPPEILESSDFSLKVFLIPKLANTSGAADLSVEFIPYDATKPEEMESLSRVTAIIKEKQVAVASKGLLKPSIVVELVSSRLPYRFTMHTHTKAWQRYGVRPDGKSTQPQQTRQDFCVYDELAGVYGYTPAWVDFLCKKLADPAEFETVTGKAPTRPPAHRDDPGT